jgi:hypothetical protein
MVAAFDVPPQGLSRNITMRDNEVKYMALPYNILLLPYIAANKSTV